MSKLKRIPHLLIMSAVAELQAWIREPRRELADANRALHRGLSRWRRCPLSRGERHLVSNKTLECKLLAGFVFIVERVANLPEPQTRYRRFNVFTSHRRSKEERHDGGCRQTKPRREGVRGASD